jgi:hypothetical protein
MGPHITIQSALRPDYDPFFYQHLSLRARRIYLFRDEYIFDLEKVVVVEAPQLGNATYLFTKPGSMDAFLAAYTKVSKDDIRRNRANIGEKLGFLGRIIHGSNSRVWAKELRARIGEASDFAAAEATGQRVQLGSDKSLNLLEKPSASRFLKPACNHSKWGQ